MISFSLRRCHSSFSRCTERDMQCPKRLRAENRAHRKLLWSIKLFDIRIWWSGSIWGWHCCWTMKRLLPVRTMYRMFVQLQTKMNALRFCYGWQVQICYTVNIYAERKTSSIPSYYFHVRSIYGFSFFYAYMNTSYRVWVLCISCYIFCVGPWKDEK